MIRNDLMKLQRKYQNVENLDHQYKSFINENDL